MSLFAGIVEEARPQERYDHWEVKAKWFQDKAPPKGSRLEQVRYTPANSKPDCLAFWDCVESSDGTTVLRMSRLTGAERASVQSGDTFLYT